MSLELAIAELEKLVGDDRGDINSDTNDNNKPKDALACEEISLKKMKKTIAKAERCGHSLQNFIVTRESNFYFKCELCDKKTNIEKILKRDNSEVVDPWEGDIEIVDIAEMEDIDVENELIIDESMHVQIKKNEDLDKTRNDNSKDNIELLLLETESDQAKSVTFDEQAVPKCSDEQSNEKDEKEESKKPRKPFLKCRVMFTGYRCKNHVKIVMDLGGKLTSKLHNCSVMVTDKLRMTSKMLSMLRRGVPVVSPAWVLECHEQGGFVDPWDFILKDQFVEKLWNFNLGESLQKENKEVFKGYSIHVTKNVEPGPELYKDIIENFGGTFTSKKLTKDDEKKSFAISCLEDKEISKMMKDDGIDVVNRDFFISAIIKQKLPKATKYSM